MLLPTLPRQALAEAATHTSGPVFYRIVQACPPGACTNCCGVRFVYLSFAKAGPFEYPPNTQKTMLHVEATGGPDGGPGGWYIVESKSYPCPVCQNGASRAQASQVAA